MSNKEELGTNHVKGYELGPMPKYGNYPQSLLDNFSGKPLLGPKAHLKSDEGHIGLLELAPGTDYPAHIHPWPEAYYIVNGSAECVWGEDKFTAEPGTTIYAPPNTSHAMKVISEEPVLAIIFGWAPGGRKEVFDEDGRLI